MQTPDRLADLADRQSHKHTRDADAGAADASYRAAFDADAERRASGRP